MDCVSYVGVFFVGCEKNFFKGFGGDMELE